MKRKYEKLVCKILTYEELDVITASNGTGEALDRAWSTEPWGSFNGGGTV